MKNRLLKERGITLIALIITVIVMLILVGVTITVALNGDLFGTASKAATETKKETERERLTEATLASYNVSDGKISDVDSLVGKLSGMGFSKDESKSSVSNAKLVVQGETTLWQIDLITAKVEPYRETYTFTVGELGSKGLLSTDSSGIMAISASSFWRDDVSEDLKNSATSNPATNILGSKKYDITFSDNSYMNMVDAQEFSAESKAFWFSISNDSNTIYFVLVNESGEQINNDNYGPYSDMYFTISMPE